MVVDQNGINIIGYEGLVEYLEDKGIGARLLGNSPLERLEVRRICTCVGRKLQKRSYGEYIR